MSVIQTDGSSPEDAHPRVEIDRSIPAHRYRYTCPRGHTDFVPTNSHVICRSCRRQWENGDDVDPEWWELLDKKTGNTIPYSAVEIVEMHQKRIPR